MSTEQKHTLIYWPIRGLGSPCRAALIYNGVAFKDDRMHDWFEEGGSRDKLHKQNNLPMANLPSLVLPDGSAITQTPTIMRYIGSLGETKPKNEVDAAQISMVIDHLMEFNAEKFKTAYVPNALENLSSFFEHSVPYYFGTLEQWMTARKTSYLATNYLSVADIFFVEYVEAFSKLKEGLDWMKDHPKLVEVYKKVVEDPKLKAYYEAEKAVPHNNPTAAKWF